MPLPPIPAADGARSLQKAVLSALEVLDRFVQRHRNQHHVAKWWSQVGILRRALRRLMEALATQESHDAVMRRRHGAGNKLSARAATTANHNREDVMARAATLCEHLLPRAYLSFTQAAADKQHAALGLFLVGLVAFLNQSLAPLVPQLPSLDSQGAAVSPRAVHAGGEVDIGVTVSRSLFDPSVLPSRPPRDTPGETAEDSKTVPTPPMKAAVSVPSGAAVPPKRKQVSGSKKITREGKPKQQKKKQGDEFANLFSSLL